MTSRTERLEATKREIESAEVRCGHCGFFGFPGGEGERPTLRGVLRRLRPVDALAEATRWRVNPALQRQRGDP